MRNNDIIIYNGFVSLPTQVFKLCARDMLIRLKLFLKKKVLKIRLQFSFCTCIYIYIYICVCVCVCVCGGWGKRPVGPCRCLYWAKGPAQGKNPSSVGEEKPFLGHGESPPRHIVAEDGRSDLPLAVTLSIILRSEKSTKAGKDNESV